MLPLLKTTSSPATHPRLSALLNALDDNIHHMVGYPTSAQMIDFSPLYPFLSYPLNNIGDPFLESSYKINSHEFEREVIDWFSDIFRADKTDVWGYVTNGGTEGNLYGIYLAREMFPSGVVYYSEDTHYSVPKILRMLHVPNITIKSQANGEMDYQDLEETLKIHRDKPPIIFANIGTTMKGAIDNIATIRKILKDKAISNAYIHADAALSGLILPFVEKPQPFGFDSGIDSISVSGHKMFGSPIPCGVAMARRKHVNRVARTVEYIGSNDTTVSGSRNGITPLFLWHAIQTLGVAGMRQTIARCVDTADYAVQLFKQRGVDAWRHDNSLTVIFPRMAEPVLKKWQVAVQDDYAHIITMNHVTKEDVALFISELTGFKE